MKTPLVLHALAVVALAACADRNPSDRDGEAAATQPAELAARGDDGRDAPDDSDDADDSDEGGAGGAAPSEHTVRLSTGVDLFYVEQGRAKGEPVVFLHGYTDSHRSFERNLPRLPRRYHAYALDQRGHGGSSKPSCCYAQSDFAADVVAFLDAMGLERATLVGHSMGSFIAHKVAAEYPERVAKLVLVGSAPTSAGNPVVLGLKDAVDSLGEPIDPAFVRDFQASTFYGPIPASFLDTAVSESLRVPLGVWRQALDGLLAEDHAAALPRVTAPTLVVWGDQDGIFTLADQQALDAAIPDSTLLVYEQTGHGPHVERPARFAHDLEQFLRLARGAPRKGKAMTSHDVFSEIAAASKYLLEAGFTPTSVGRALAMVGHATRVDRVYIFECQPGPAGVGLLASQRYEWSGGAAAQIDNPELQDVPLREMAPGWEEQLVSGEAIEVRTREAPPPLHELLASQQILSLLVCPITAGAELWGFVGFDDCHRERTWPERELAVLRALARSFGGALRHVKMRLSLAQTRLSLKDVIARCEAPPSR
jgi:non-heme chloroperoxidase